MGEGRKGRNMAKIPKNQAALDCPRRPGDSDIRSPAHLPSNLSKSYT